MRILYVEDNPANLSLMLRIARMGGHEVISYTEGEAALANYDKDRPDIVLLDLQLAGAISGLDVVKTLRQRGSTLPIVAVTAYAMVGDKERCMEAGFSGYLAKPLPVAELVELVQRYELELKQRDTSSVDAKIATPVAEPVTPLPNPAVPPPAIVAGVTSLTPSSAENGAHSHLPPQEAQSVLPSEAPIQPTEQTALSKPDEPISPSEKTDDPQPVSVMGSMTASATLLETDTLPEKLHVIPLAQPLPTPQKQPVESQETRKG